MSLSYGGFIEGDCRNLNLTKMQKFIFTNLLVLFLCLNLIGQTTHTVINTDDSGAGSLRQAITDAANGDIIEFNIPGAGPHNLNVTSTLGVSKSLTIEGITACTSCAMTPTCCL